MHDQIRHFLFCQFFTLLGDLELIRASPIPFPVSLPQQILITLLKFLPLVVYQSYNFGFLTIETLAFFFRFFRTASFPAHFIF